MRREFRRLISYSMSAELFALSLFLRAFGKA